MHKNTHTSSQPEIIFKSSSTSCHIAHNTAKCIQKLRLVPRLQDHQIHVDLQKKESVNRPLCNLFNVLSSSHLLTVLQLLQNTVIIRLGDTFREATGRLNKHLQGSLQQLIHLAVIVVVVPYPIDALNVVPDCASELGRVHISSASLKAEQRKGLIIKSPGACTEKTHNGKIC